MENMYNITRDWWAFIVRGIAAIVFGFLFLSRPGRALAALVLVFGIYAIVDGAFALFSGIDAGVRRERWGFLVMSGVLGIAAGVVTLAWPHITAMVLFYLIAFWALFTGTMQLITAIRFRRLLAHEWTLGLAGALAIILGILMLAQPIAGLYALVGVIAGFAIVFGGVNIALGAQLRSVGHALEIPIGGARV
jgi:uncharacterized membrane protein HdeD (DUF308 family)